MEDPNRAYFVVLSGVLFTLGTLGVLLPEERAPDCFMSVELQLNTQMRTGRVLEDAHGALDGQVLAFFSMVVAAAEEW